MRFFSMLFVLATVISPSSAKDQFQAGDFVKRHLNSVGDESARIAVKNRMAQGPAVFRTVLGATPQSWNGEQTLVSEDDRLASLLKFPASVFRTEWFVRNGKKTSITPVRPGSWSVMGRFVMIHDEILKEGLWGGTLSTGWALSHMDQSGAKLVDRGLKKVGESQLHRVDYVPKKGSDLEIQLFFEPDSFRHVMTVYTLRVAGGLDPDSAPAATEGETRYQLEEFFSDFKQVDSLTLPGRWTIQFSYGWPSFVSINRYDVVEEKISHNLSIDPKSFDPK